MPKHKSCHIKIFNSVIKSFKFDNVTYLYSIILVYNISQNVPKLHMQNIGYLSDKVCLVNLLNFQHLGHRKVC